MRVSGYRVAYSTADGSEPEDGSAARLLGDVLSGVGLDELVGESLAHLPLSREVLLALGVPPVRPDRVMLRIAYDDRARSRAGRTIEALTMRGYALSLYDLPGAEFDASLLERFGTVEIDFARVRPGRQTTLAVPRIRAGRGDAAGRRADRLHTQFEQAKALGFELFAGPFYASRAPGRGPQGPGRARWARWSSLAAMQSGSATIEELEQVIDRDVGLSVKLLRYINSAYIGMRGSITSIRQAVMMLGSRGVSRWALLVALTGGPSAPRELSVMGLTRARMCELLGSEREDVGGDRAVHGRAAVGGRRAARRSARDDRRRAAAVRRGRPRRCCGATGRPASILDAVVSYEQGEFDAAGVAGAQRGHRHVVSRRARLGRRRRLRRWPERPPIPYPAAAVKRVRVDTLLSERGMFPSRSQAAASVLAGDVLLLPERRRGRKPGQLVADDVELEVVGAAAVRLARRDQAGAMRCRRLAWRWPAGARSMWAPRPAGSPTACSRPGPRTWWRSTWPTASSIGGCARTRALR